MQSFSRMISTLVNLASIVLGKYFLSIESFRCIPDELVEKIFDEYLKSIARLAIVQEDDLMQIVNKLTDYHSDGFCTSFSYHQSNYLNLLTPNFYLRLFQQVQETIVQLDFSHVFNKFDCEIRGRFLNLIGQMENIEYLRLTHNQFDDDDIRLLTASHRIRSQALCNLHSLHLQGTKRSIISIGLFRCESSRKSSHQSISSFSKSINIASYVVSIAILFFICKSISHLCEQIFAHRFFFFFFEQEKAVFVKELENLRECTCSTQHAWEEIINRGWIAKIPQLQATTIAEENHFCRNFYTGFPTVFV